jgi:hypothetical protein
MAPAEPSPEPGPPGTFSVRDKISHPNPGKRTVFPGSQGHSSLLGDLAGHQSCMPHPRDSPEFGLGGSYFPQLIFPDRKG